MALGQPDSEHIDRDGQSLALLLIMFSFLKFVLNPNID